MNREKIKKVIIQIPYNYFFYLWIILFLTLNFFLNEIYITGLGIFNYELIIIIPYLTFMILNSILISISINLIIFRYKEIKSVNPKNTFLSTIALFFYFIAGACPGCISGIFPFIFGAVLGTFTLSSLPLYGIEIQLLSTILLLVSINYMSNDLVCRVKYKTKEKNKK